MAFCGRGVFIVFVLGLYLVHSDRSLIEESCKDWENDLGLDRFEDVDFDGEYSLTKLQCGKEVSLDRFTDQAPTVKYPKAVRTLSHFTISTTVCWVTVITCTAAHFLLGL